MREWLAGVLIRMGLHLASDSHAYWLWKIQTLYWNSVAGRELRRRLGLDEDDESRSAPAVPKEEE